MPDLFVYTPEQQDQMADEIEGGSCPAMTEAMKDYMVVRDQIRGKVITRMEPR